MTKVKGVAGMATPVEKTVMYPQGSNNETGSVLCAADNMSLRIPGSKERLRDHPQDKTYTRQSHNNAPTDTNRGLNKPGSKNLIREIGSSEFHTHVPKHHLESSPSGHLTLTVELPGVSSVSECDLDMSEVTS